MKIQFDPDQPFQRDAVDAVVDLFDGQPRRRPEFAVMESPVAAHSLNHELGPGNQLWLSEERLRANLRAVQARNAIEVADPGAAP